MITYSATRIYVHTYAFGICYAILENWTTNIAPVSKAYRPLFSSLPNSWPIHVQIRRYFKYTVVCCFIFFFSSNLSTTIFFSVGYWFLTNFSGQFLNSFLKSLTFLVLSILIIILHPEIEEWIWQKKWERKNTNIGCRIKVMICADLSGDVWSAVWLE